MWHICNVWGCVYVCVEVCAYVVTVCSLRSVNLIVACLMVRVCVCVCEPYSGLSYGVCVCVCEPYSGLSYGVVCVCVNLIVACLMVCVCVCVCVCVWFCLKQLGGLPRWCSGKESACQCRRRKRHEFSP